MGETPQAALDRAYLSVGRPWISTATREKLLEYSSTLSTTNQNGTAAANKTARRTRLYALQAMILGGPDGQVM